jgi:hypothetical protein
VEEDEFIVHPFANEALEDLVDIVLHRLVTDEAEARIYEVLVENLEALSVAPEVIEHVHDILRGRSHLAFGILSHEVEVLVVGQDAVLRFVLFFDRAVDLIRVLLHSYILCVCGSQVTDSRAPLGERFDPG